jgi:2-methylisocitrate lyase-like PEP mutase family enzyme
MSGRTTEGANLDSAWRDWRAGERSFILAPGVYDGLSAKIAGSIGFDAVYMIGYGTAAALGLPDAGLATLTEMAANVARVAEASGLPVIADADTGYGNALNVQRTARAYQRAGGALHLEDQVFPKKCGFLEGKQVISAAGHAQKIRAACEARDGDGLVIIARTDALALTGWAEVEDRIHAYREAGADVVFVAGLRTRDDLDNYVSRVVAAGVPALYNGTLIAAAEAEQAGFAIQIMAGAALTAAFSEIYRALQLVHDTGDLRPIMREIRDAGPTGPAMDDVLGVPEVYDVERRYSP